MYSPADYADNAEECSKLHYIAEKDRQVRLRLFCCLWFVCVNLRDLRETCWGLCVQYRLSKFGCVFSRRLRRSRREECSGAALFRRERQIGEVNVVLWVLSSVVLGFVCDYLRDLRENRPFKSVRRATSNKVKHRAM